MDVQPDVARVAALLADPARSRILLYLMDGRAQPASLIAAAAGVAASTASSHLGRLVDEGALSVEQHGRHRYYRIGDPRIVAVVETMLPLAETPVPTNLKASNRLERLRHGRTCYDHAAGRLGTRILLGLLECEALTRTDGEVGIAPAAADALSAPVREAPYVLGRRAESVFGAVGVDLSRPRTTKRPLIRACMDWTEQRHHLSGALGALTLDALLARGWVERSSRPRELVVRESEALGAWLSGGG